MDDWRLRVCLDRVVELEGVRLRVRDWPGVGGPLVHVPDPLLADDTLVVGLADALAPRYRVLSVQPRGGSPYQVDAIDLLGTLDQFGFATPVLVAEGLGCVAALLVAAWYRSRVAGLVLVEPGFDAPSSSSDGLPARALRDCPPDRRALRQAVECPVLEVPRRPGLVAEVAAFMGQLGPGVI